VLNGICRQNVCNLRRLFNLVACYIEFRFMSVCWHIEYQYCVMLLDSYNNKHHSDFCVTFGFLEEHLIEYSLLYSLHRGSVELSNDKDLLTLFTPNFIQIIPYCGGSCKDE